MSQEIERKFLTLKSQHIRRIIEAGPRPHSLHVDWLEALGAQNISIARMWQSYLALELDDEGRVIEEERVRKKIILGPDGQPIKEIYTHTYKSGSGISRPEEQEKITEKDYSKLLSIGKVGIEVSKFRTTFEMSHRTIQLDRYLNGLSGLSVSEIEFKDLGQSDQFNPALSPFTTVLGKEVTGQNEYSNAILASTGVRPDEY